MKPWNIIDKLVWGLARIATSFAIPFLASKGISPNQVTLVSALVNFSLAGFCFAQGTHGWSLAGLFFLLVHAYFDFADGDLARATGKTTRLGHWLDPRLDIIGAEIVVVSIIFGFLRFNQSFFWLIIVALVIISRVGLLSVVFDYHRAIYTDNRFRNDFKNDRKMTIFDKIIKEFMLLESFPFLFFGTFRYFLFLMILLNQFKWFLLTIAIFNNIRWIIMFWGYSLALGESKNNLRVINLLRTYVKNEKEPVHN